MSFLLIPVAPLYKTKSRLRDCFSREQLKDLTIAMFKDLCNKLSEVNNYDGKIVYCNSPEILELAEDYNLIGIKEEIKEPPLSFDNIISDFNKIVIEKYDVEETIIVFLDLILISKKNFYEIKSLMKKNSILVCPAITSAGISILGRNPSNIQLDGCFSDPTTTSLVSLNKIAKKEGLKITYYDSFRASFDVDVKQDLILAHKYLKIFNLRHTETHLFLNKNQKLTLQKKNKKINRDFNITEKI